MNATHECSEMFFRPKKEFLKYTKKYSRQHKEKTMRTEVDSHMRIINHKKISSMLVL